MPRKGKQQAQAAKAATAAPRAPPAAPSGKQAPAAELAAATRRLSAGGCDALSSGELCKVLRGTKETLAAQARFAAAGSAASAGPKKVRKRPGSDIRARGAAHAPRRPPKRPPRKFASQFGGKRAGGRLAGAAHPVSARSDHRYPSCHHRPRSSLPRHNRRLTGTPLAPPARTFGANSAKAVGELSKALLQKGVARNKDTSVRLLAACCLAETMRLFAPDHPFQDKQLKDLLRLFTSAFAQGLAEPGAARFTWALELLRSCVETRAVVVFLDLEDVDDQLVRLFETVFDCASEGHSHEVLDLMASLLALLISEMDDLPQPLLDVILANLLKAPAYTFEAAAAAYADSSQSQSSQESSAGVVGATAQQGLAKALLQRCEDKLDQPIARFLTSSIQGDSLSEQLRNSELRREYRKVVLAVHAVQPRLLLHVLPTLQSELEVEDVTSRKEAIATLGKVFSAAPKDGVDTAVDYKHTLFPAFLGRFHDKEKAVRVQMLAWGRLFLESRHTPAEGAKKRSGVVSGPAAECAAAVTERMAERLLDTNDAVREAATNALLGAATTAGAGVLTKEALEAAAARLSDKKVTVRRAALNALAALYRTQGSVSAPQHDRLGWVPGKVLQGLLPSLELVRETEELLASGLTPAGASAEERAACWAFALAKVPSGLASKEVTALTTLLARKAEGRTALVAFLSSNPAGRGNKAEGGPDSAKLAERAGRIAGGEAHGELLAMAAETVRDARVWKRALEACSAETSPTAAAEARADALARLGSKHSAAPALRRCLAFAAYDVLDCEVAEAVLAVLEKGAHSGNANRAVVNANCGLLRVLAKSCPELLEGRVERVTELAAGKDRPTADAAVAALATLGGSSESAREAIAGSVSALERHALRSRSGAKDAVAALSTLGGTASVEALGRVCSKAVAEMGEGKRDVLPGGERLPVLLQAMACAAQRCSEAYVPHESAFARFLVQRILQCPCGEEGDPETVGECAAIMAEETDDMDEDVDDAWDDVATPASTAHELALKALARSFDYQVHSQEAAQQAATLRRKGLMGAMRVLHGVLSKGGELLPGLCGRGARGDVRRSRCRVAAAKGVLRLARRWESSLPAALVHEATLVMQDASFDARAAMLGAVRKRLLRNDLKMRWATPLALGAVDVERENADAARLALDSWASRRRAALAVAARRAAAAGTPGPSPSAAPEAAVPFAVHMLAHHPDYDYEHSPPLDAAEAPFGSFQRVLACLLAAVLAPDASLIAGGGALPTVLATLRGIKRCDDVTSKGGEGAIPSRAAAQRLHTLADVALAIAKGLAARAGTDAASDATESTSGAGVVLPTSLFVPNLAQYSSTSDGAHLPAGFELIDLKGFVDKKGHTAGKTKAGSKAKATGKGKGKDAVEAAPEAKGGEAKASSPKRRRAAAVKPAEDEAASEGEEEYDFAAQGDGESEGEGTDAQEVLPVSRRAAAKARGTPPSTGEQPSPPKRARRGAAAAKTFPAPSLETAANKKPLGNHNAGGRRATRTSTRA